MEYTDIKEWLDHLIELDKERYNCREFNSEIMENVTPPTGILLHCGIEVVADILGLEVTETRVSDSEYGLDWMYKFQYGDCTIRQLEKERLAAFREEPEV